MFEACIIIYLSYQCVCCMYSCMKYICLRPHFFLVVMLYIFFFLLLLYVRSFDVIIHDTFCINFKVCIVPFFSCVAGVCLFRRLLDAL